MTVPVKVDAHSELMTAYPWGFDGVKPNASDNIADHGAYADGRLQFTDDGALPGAPEHHYAALVGADQPADSGEAADTGGAFRGPQGDHVVPERRPARRCPRSATTGRSARAPAASCATRSPSRPAAPRRCGSRSRARTRA